MNYSTNPALQSVYELLARLYGDDLLAENAEAAMVIADALIECGEVRNWATVWWAYGALHHDLRDEAYQRALELLPHVAASTEARAAALMLEAEILSTWSYQRGEEPDAAEQMRLLSAAVALVSGWPDLQRRLADAALAAGDEDCARRSLDEARRALGTAASSDDPFDQLISGRAVEREFVAEQLARLEARLG